LRRWKTPWSSPGQKGDDIAPRFYAARVALTAVPPHVILNFEVIMDTKIKSTMCENEIILTIPEYIAEKCRQNGFEVQKDLKQCLAVRLYQNSIVSIGKAAELAGMDRVEFEYFLSNNNIPISNLTLGDIMADVEKLKDIKAVS
jgi:predicted HTH domain antitoxin